VRSNYCIPFLELSGNVTFTPIIQPLVSGYIKSTEAINSGVFVNYKAGTYIELNPGFNSGTDFIAEIDPCVSIVTVIAFKTDGESVSFEESTIDDNKHNEWIKVYPTILPSGKSITIEAGESINGVDLMMYNIEGKHIRTFRLNGFEASSKMSVVIENLNAGLYFLKAGDQKRIFTQKIIIQ